MTEIQIITRRDTSADWTTFNPVLANGEFGIETDTRSIKIGDGITAWNDLPYYGDKFAPHENGHKDRTQSTITFDDLTRTFSIQPTGTEYTFYVDSIKYVKTGETFIIPNVKGLHYVYYDETGTLVSTQAFIPELITRYAFTAAVYWNVVQQKGILFEDERHGSTMDSATHIYNHVTFGTRYESGLGLSNMTVDGNGTLAAHAQVAVNGGSIWDEDIQHVIANGAPQTLSPIAEIPLYYRSGADGDWFQVAATQYPVTTTGTGLPAWNENTGATWQLTEAGTTDYVLTHLFATGDVNNPIIGIVGQATYNNLNDAQDGAGTELTALELGPLETLSPEYYAIATLIFEAKSSFSNAVKAAIASTSDGSAYIDWRELTRAAPGSASAGTVPAWGDITGTLSNQTDLQAALDEKTSRAADEVVTGAWRFDESVDLRDTLVVNMTAFKNASFRRYVGNSGGANLEFYKSRGTLASPLPVNAGDDVFAIYGVAENGAGGAALGDIRFGVAGISGSAVNGTFGVRTSNTSGVLQDRISVDGAGNVGVGNITPTEKLDVDGKIRMRTETVAADASDTVVTKGYIDTIANLPTPIELVGEGFLTSRTTVTNANGTRVNQQGLIEAVPPNTPRLDYDPVAREFLGPLIEEARTNLLTYSEQLDNAAWSKFDVTVTANNTNSPDGSISAESVTEGTGGTYKEISRGATTTASTSYTLSAFIKNNTGARFLGVSLSPVPDGDSWVSVRFDPTTGAVAGSNVKGTGVVLEDSGSEDFGNGWFRVWVTGQIGANTNMRVNFHLALDAVTFPAGNRGRMSYTGDGTSGIYIWGAQLEQASEVSSYIPTVASAVTRTADNLVIDGERFADMWRADEGTLVAEWVQIAPDGVFGRIIEASDGGVNNRITINRDDDQDLIAAVIRSGGANTFAEFPVVSQGVVRAAIGFSDAASLSINGGAAITDSAVTIPTVDRLYIGSANGVLPANTHIRRLAYHPQRLTNTQLEALSVVGQDYPTAPFDPYSLVRVTNSSGAAVAIDSMNGAIIERGSNANGEYVKFADGTQICTLEISVSLSISTAIYGGFRSAGQLTNFPAAFIVPPATSAFVISNSAFGAISIATANADSWWWAVTAVTTQVAATRTVQLLAIGRWYN